MMDLMGIIGVNNQGLPTQNFSCNNVNFLIEAMTPPNNFLDKFSNFCEIMASSSNDGQLYDNKMKLLNAFYLFYNSIGMYLNIMAGIMESFGTCSNLGICKFCKQFQNETIIAKTLKDFSSKMNSICYPILECIKSIENSKMEEMRKHIEDIITLNERLALKTRDGHNVCFIEGDKDHNMFVQLGDGLYIFPTYEQIWDVIEEKYVPQFTEIPVIIDKNTGVVTSPPQFAGKPEPSAAYVTFDDLYKELTENTLKSEAVIKRISEQTSISPFESE
jgi:hypothetical protein